MTFALLCLYAMSVRWLLFKYKHTTQLRSLLKRPNWVVLNELLGCCYCQTFEAAVIVQLLLWLNGQPTAPIVGLLNCLAIAWIAILLESWFEQAIARMEYNHQFPLPHVHHPVQPQTGKISEA